MSRKKYVDPVVLECEKLEKKVIRSLGEKKFRRLVVKGTKNDKR